MLPMRKASISEMRSLVPSSASAKDIYDLTISRVSDEDLGLRLRSASVHIGSAEALYIHLARAHDLHEFPTDHDIGDASPKELVTNYEQRFRGMKSPGRDCYLALRSIATLCPLCGCGRVASLDHYLPKSRFPELAVTPTNLIPSCLDCNGSKLASTPTTRGEQTLHPFFDEFDGEVWLSARIYDDKPGVFLFEVSAPARWSPKVVARLETHLHVFELKRLFASQAASEYSGAVGRFKGTLERVGTAGLIDELERHQKSLEDDQRNSWQAAMYRALSSSTWFAKGGWWETG